MASLITEKTDAELHEDALKEDTERTEAKESLEDEKAEQSSQLKILRIDLPVDELLNASRAQKKEFFAHMVKNIKAQIETIRQERRIKQ